MALGIARQMALGAAGNRRRPTAAYSASGANYDGTNDLQLRGSDLTGNADSKAGTFAATVRFGAAGDGIAQRILTNQANAVSFFKTAANKFQITCQNAALANILAAASTASITSADGWVTILASWDLAAGALHMYLGNGSIAPASPTTLTNDTIDYTRTDWAVGAQIAGTQKLNADLCELFFHNTYIDLSDINNRLKFLDRWGRPISLGATGSTPLGVQPLIYIPTGDGSGTGNKGSGGAFTTTGALTASSTGPTDS